MTLQNDKEDIYSGFAEVYDYFYQKTDDINFYVNLAKKYGGPILELACGTGRILLPIAREGFDIVGLDISDSMLNILREKLTRESESVKNRVQIFKGDVRSFDLNRKFKLIVLPFSSIVHLLTADDVLSMLKSIKKHLMEGGLFVFDTFIPNLSYLAKRERIVFDIRELKDGILTLWESARYDLTNHQISVNRYVELKMGEEVKKVIWRFKIRFWFKSELELLLRLAGFNNFEVYSGYDLDTYSYDKSPMIFFVRNI